MSEWYKKVSYRLIDRSKTVHCQFDQGSGVMRDEVAVYMDTISCFPPDENLPNFGLRHDPMIFKSIKKTLHITLMLVYCVIERLSRLVLHQQPNPQ